MVKAIAKLFTAGAALWASAYAECDDGNCAAGDDEVGMLQVKSGGDAANLFGSQGHHCQKKTGGTCSLVWCDSSRNAECTNGECVCPHGYCAVNGACKKHRHEQHPPKMPVPAPIPSPIEVAPMPMPFPPTSGDYIGIAAVSQGAGFVVTNPKAKILIGKFQNCANTKWHVPCGFGTSSMCSGNQCCPGVAASGHKTFKCPTADTNWNQCQSNMNSNVDTWNAEAINDDRRTSSNKVTYVNTNGGTADTVVKHDLTIGTYRCNTGR